MLEVYDICNASDFPDAPTVVEDGDDYWIGSDDLVVTVNWTDDSVTGNPDTEYDCGPFDISAELDSVGSTFKGTPYDPTKNSITQDGTLNSLKISFAQPDLSGVIKFNLEISSDDIDETSPNGVLTLNVHSCEVKEEEWAVTKTPVENVKYNIIDPAEAARPIVTFNYEGPPLAHCDEPEFTIIDGDGVEIPFLSG